MSTSRPLNWTRAIDALPPDGVVVDTKTHDHRGVRNHMKLKRVGSLWFLPDGSMHVYCEPTDWRHVSEDVAATPSQEPA
jgi:hypothetical protein